MAVRLKPAASLIVLWQDMAGGTQVFMGRRHESLRFLPGFLVFPGGRVEAQDRRVDTTPYLEESSLAKLNDESRERGEALAGAAVRECLEETGLAVVSHLAKPLRYVARAITPPNLPIRYDTRFFLAHVVAGDSPPKTQALGDGELLLPAWYDVDVVRTEKLHHVTHAVLRHALAMQNDDERVLRALLVADRVPQRWQGLSPLRSRNLKASVQDR